MLVKRLDVLANGMNQIVRAADQRTIAARQSQLTDQDSRLKEVEVKLENGDNRSRSIAR